MYEKAKKFYEAGMWTKTHLKNAVEKGALTPEEYEKITHEKYTAGE